MKLMCLYNYGENELIESLEPLGAEPRSPPLEPQGALPRHDELVRRKRQYEGGIAPPSNESGKTG